MILAGGRDLIQKQLRALVEALTRYGYTCVGFPERRDYWRDPGSYHSDINPYDVVIDEDDNGKEGLLILHRNCTDCSRNDLVDHEGDFLRAMIPVIGRLDAVAHYDPCDPPGKSPRLWIYL